MVSEVKAHHSTNWPVNQSFLGETCAGSTFLRRSKCLLRINREFNKVFPHKLTPTMRSTLKQLMGTRTLQKAVFQIGIYLAVPRMSAMESISSPSKGGYPRAVTLRAVVVELITPTLRLQLEEERWAVIWVAMAAPLLLHLRIQFQALSFSASHPGEQTT